MLGILVHNFVENRNKTFSRNGYVWKIICNKKLFNAKKVQDKSVVFNNRISSSAEAIGKEQRNINEEMHFLRQIKR